MSFKLPEKAKPSKVVGDAQRPMLEAAHLAIEDDLVVLYATNTFSFLRLPIRKRLDADVHEGPIPVVALRHLERGVTFTATREHIRAGITQYDRVLNEEGMRAEPGKSFPDYNKLRRPKPKRKFRVGLNAKLLHDLAQAMGAMNGVALEFDLEDLDAYPGSGYPVWHKAIPVEPLHIGHEAEGLIMPIRNP